MSDEEIKPLKLTKSEKKDNGSNFDPLSDVKQVILKYYSTGQLPLFLLIFVQVYNLTFFGLEEGYAFYTILPLIATIGLLLTGYWNRKENRKIVILTIVLFILSAGFDILVSISFELNPPEPRFQYRTFPALFSDIFAIGAFIGWYFEYNTLSEEELKELAEKSAKKSDIDDDWDEQKSQDMVEQMIAKSDQIDEKVKQMDEEDEQPVK